MYQNLGKIHSVVEERPKPGETWRQENCLAWGTAERIFRAKEFPHDSFFIDQVITKPLCEVSETWGLGLGFIRWWTWREVWEGTAETRDFWKITASVFLCIVLQQSESTLHSWPPVCMLTPFPPCFLACLLQCSQVWNVRLSWLTQMPRSQVTHLFELKLLFKLWGCGLPMTHGGRKCNCVSSVDVFLTGAALGLNLHLGFMSFDKTASSLQKQLRHSVMESGFVQCHWWPWILSLSFTVSIGHSTAQSPEFGSSCEQWCVLKLVLWGSRGSVHRLSPFGHPSLSFQPSMEQSVDTMHIRLHGSYHKQHMQMPPPWQWDLL